MPRPAPGSLPVTGERTVPDTAAENYWFRRHEVAYRWAASTLPTTGWVLDAGCGEGYGTALLDRPGRRAVALDYDVATVAHARSRYDLPTLRANLVALPLADAVVGALVSLQVVEHLWDQPTYVAECARVLRPDGVCVLSTPNRLTFSPDGRPANLFHTVELSAAELADLLSPSFPVVRMYGVHHGPRLHELDDRFGGLVQAQLARGPDTWSAELAAAVAGISAGDFVVAPDHPSYPLAESRDLLAVARRSPA